MTELARIVKHPTDPDVVLVHTPPELKNELGRFEAARYSREHRAYLLHNDHIPAFYRFARTITMHVVDERARAVSGNRTLPVECANCAQPGSLGRPPKVCPACGQDWRPVNPPVRVEARGLTECGTCHARQGGRFPFCHNCGAQMVYERKPAPVLDFDAVRARKRLDAPVSLQESMRRLIPETSGPRLHPWHKGRPVENVDLPEPPEPDDDVGPGW